MPPFVGLTGGIGAGKSTALAALERLGAAVLSTDAVVHDLYREPKARDAVVARFGDVVAPDGVVDRAVLAEHAFASDADTRWLEQLLWPMVGARISQWHERVNSDAPPARAAVVEVPLLFESGTEAAYDATIAVIAPEAVRAERAAARGHRALDARGSRQLTQEEKAARSTFVVVNDGDFAALESALSSVLDMLTR